MAKTVSNGSKTTTGTSVPDMFKASPITPPVPTSVIQDGPEAAVAEWRDITLAEASTLPVSELMYLLGVTLVEFEDGELSEDGLKASLVGRVGNAEVFVERSMPQAEREIVVRELLQRINLDQGASHTIPLAPESLRLRPVLVRGVTADVECPAFCTNTHVVDNLEEVSHSGGSVELLLPESSSATDVTRELFDVRISEDPFCTGEQYRQTHIMLDTPDEGFILNGPGALEFADRMTVVADAIRRMVAEAGL
jgi:hypothetical protein